MLKNKVYPDIYIDNITTLSLDYLKKNNIKGIIVDMDNTLLNHKAQIKLKGLEDWVKKVKAVGIKLVIVTNSIKRDNVVKTSKYYDIPYVYAAIKPFGFGLNLGKKKLNLDNENIAVVGDQIFTDVLGANRKNMHSVLVLPIKRKKESFVTKLLRKLEKDIIKKYLKTNHMKTKETINN